MPRLELLSCLMLSDLMAMVKKRAEGELKIERIYCWSDSLVALFWVKSRNELWKAWGATMGEEELKNVGKEVRRYIKTNKTSADIGTRENSLQLFN